MLKAYTKDPACVPPLLQQMRSSQHEQARQLAAVLLKKKIMVHWKSFTDQEKVRAVDDCAPSLSYRAMQVQYLHDSVNLKSG